MQQLPESEALFGESYLTKSSSSWDVLLSNRSFRHFHGIQEWLTVLQREQSTGRFPSCRSFMLNRLFAPWGSLGTWRQQRLFAFPKDWMVLTKVAIVVHFNGETVI